MKGLLLFDDGTIFEGKGFGKKATKVGELVFNTSMVGYQEILTDPSCTGQIISFSYPLIGNYGISAAGNESDRIHAYGMVARSVSITPSHYTSEDRIDHWLEEMGIPGVFGVDTRAITRKIRNEGSVKCTISTEDISPEEAKELCRQTELRQDSMKTAGVKKVLHMEGRGPRVAVLDLGMKNSLLQCLIARGFDIYVFPYASTAEDLLAVKPGGILLSNGPGNPKAASEAVREVKNLMKQPIPIFGICLGHHIMALALGCSIFKLKFGHRGGNHGVHDKNTGLSYITTQNHGYAVWEESAVQNGLEITHTNLNDGTVEGLKHLTLPFFSVQFHPEASPGRKDSAYLFDHFVNLMEGGANNAQK